MPTVTRGGPPLITDDPGTPGRNQWEINVSYGLSLTEESIELPPTRRQEFAFDVANRVFDRLGVFEGLGPLEPRPRSVRRRVYQHEAPLIDINYGVTDLDQIKFEIPVFISDPADGGTEGGFGNMVVGYKFRFLDESAAPLSISLYPQVELPTGARRLGANRKPAYLLPLQAGRHLLDDRLFVYGEIGFGAAPGKGSDDGWFYGVAAEYELVDGLTVLGEINGSVPTHGVSESDVLFNVGFKWAIHENVSFMAAMGRSFRSSGPDHPDLLGFFGVQCTS